MTTGRQYLLDTNILGLLAELKADSSSAESQVLKRHWEALPSDAKIFLCPITIGEVEYGLLVGPYDKPEKHEMARKTISAFPLLDINADLARNHYAVLRAKLFKLCSPRKKRSHYNKRIEEWIDPTTAKTLQVQENDLWIASVAIAHNLILVTRDKMNAIKKVVGTDLYIEHWL